MPGAVHDDLALDVTRRRPYAGHGTALGEYVEHRDALDDPGTGLPRAAGQRHRDVDRVRAAVLGDVEAGQHVVGTGQREQLADLAGRDLVHVDAAAAG